MNKPFDEDFAICMIEAAKALCKSIDGVKIGYVQSDEISLLITDLSKETTQPWFGYELRKMCSIASSICSTTFLIHLMKRFPEISDKISAGTLMPPNFDARFWNHPEDEIKDYFVWRQTDCIKNSKNALGRKYFSHNQMYKKNSDEIVSMLIEQHNVDWNSIDNKYKYGSIIEKISKEENISYMHKKTGEVISKTINKWEWIDSPAPFFYKEME